MSSYRLAGALWLMAGLACTGLLILVFVGENLNDLNKLLQDPVLPGLVLGGAVVALLTGGLLIGRPGARVARWASVVGVAWAFAFGSLFVSALGGPDPGPLMSSSLITVLGAAGALVAYLSLRSGLPTD